jgi:hypothetical protein
MRICAGWVSLTFGVSEALEQARNERVLLGRHHKMRMVDDHDFRGKAISNLPAREVDGMMVLQGIQNQKMFKRATQRENFGHEFAIRD